MAKTSDFPFGSQFSPNQVDLPALLGVIHDHSGDRKAITVAIRDRYFAGHGGSDRNRWKMADNVVLSMRDYGLLDESGASPTALANELFALSTSDQPEMYTRFARHILLECKGIILCETFTTMRIIKADGSIVIDIGGAWVKGQPTRSLYHYKLAVTLVEELGLHLAQEFFWYNPAKLPSPAEWVTVRRVRVKDAVNVVWWFSKTAHPKADNRKVLRPYSDSMRSLLRNGYRAKKRPSGHDISENFNRDHGGAIPPNLIALANTDSNSTYLRMCREQGIAPHPARFPHDLPRFFIEFLTDRDDLVIDPFAGSNVTGEVCESLQRRWIAVEIFKEYLDASRFRFLPLEIEEPDHPHRT